MSKLLIVDDETNIRTLINKYASSEGFTCLEATDGNEAISALKQNSDIDIVVMDIMMPNKDGFSALKEIRTFSLVPCIMLSARSEEYDKLYGLDSGADDYVTKPFSVKELISRIKAIIRRTTKDNNTYSYKTLNVDFEAHKVKIDSLFIELTNKEFSILQILILNKSKIVTRQDLVEQIWDNLIETSDRTLDAHMKSLRKKLLNYGDLIVTLRKVGYRFEEK